MQLNYVIYKLMLYYATYIIIINRKNFNWSKKKKKRNIKYNNLLKSIVVRRLAEQHLM